MSVQKFNNTEKAASILLFLLMLSSKINKEMNRTDLTLQTSKEGHFMYNQPDLVILSHRF